MVEAQCELVSEYGNGTHILAVASSAAMRAVFDTIPLKVSDRPRLTCFLRPSNSNDIKA